MTVQVVLGGVDDRLAELVVGLRERELVPREVRPVLVDPRRCILLVGPYSHIKRACISSRPRCRSPEKNSAMASPDPARAVTMGSCSFSAMATPRSNHGTAAPFSDARRQ